MRLQEARLSAGEVAATSRTGQLTVAPDGRLRGTIDIDVTRAPVALSALARTEFVDDAAAGVASTVAQAREDRERRARMAVTFEAGVTTVGPIQIGPAPKLF